MYALLRWVNRPCGRLEKIKQFPPVNTGGNIFYDLHIYFLSNSWYFNHDYSLTYRDWRSLQNFMAQPAVLQKEAAVSDFILFHDIS